MTERRITVWVQRFNDRSTLMLQWLDPETGRRKSKSAGTAKEGEAEQARSDLEYELNHGRYQEASRMTWEHFREKFETEYAAALRRRKSVRTAATGSGAVRRAAHRGYASSEGPAVTRRVDPVLTRLLHGPYVPAALRRGDYAVCLYRDCEVIIT
jgi:hypothetical protein